MTQWTRHKDKKVLKIVVVSEVVKTGKCCVKALLHNETGHTALRPLYKKSVL